MPATYNITVGSVPTPTHYFGNLTAAGVAPVDIGGSGLTIVSGNSLAHFATSTSGGRTLLAPTSTGDAANLNAGPYTFILSDGNSVVVSIEANAKSVNTLAQLKTALQAGVAYGTTIFLRTGGTYNTGGEAIAPVFSGTWTAPANYANYDQGVDLDTGSYVRIRPHPGEVVTITDRLQIYGQTGTGYGRIRLTGLIFNVTDAGATSPLDSAGMFQPMGGSHFAVDGCTFQALNSTDNGQLERRTGIYAPVRSGFACTYMHVQDCGFYDCWNCIIQNGDCLGSSHVGNTYKDFWNDGVKIGGGNNYRFNWNLMFNKRKSVGLNAHPDFFQINATGKTADIVDNRFIGNTIVRGAGTAGQNDGQGMFLADLGSIALSTNVWLRPVFVGNRILCGYANGISLFLHNDRPGSDVGCVDAFIRNNTVLNDKTQDGVGNTTYIRMDCLDTGTDQKYNLQTASSVPSDDILVTRYSGYDTYFDGGQAMQGSGIGSTLAAISANFAVKAGSAADTASPKVGAHQAYFNYVARTTSLPYALPTPPA